MQPLFSGARLVRRAQLLPRASKVGSRVLSCSQYRGYSEAAARSPANSQPATADLGNGQHTPSLPEEAKNAKLLHGIQVGKHIPYHPVFLRDSCTCPRCVDPSSTQKNFQTTDIPTNLKAKSVRVMENQDVAVTWENDIPGFGDDHVSVFSMNFLNTHSTPYHVARDRSNTLNPRVWSKNRIRKELEYIDFKDYMENDTSLYRALTLLNLHGLLILRGVPESEKSVEGITGRIGNIRDTFYGRTWDVKSVPKAKNVAYTHQFLGLHMDLLYMTNPPGFQFLHCLKNTCEGGASLFSDSFNAAANLSPEDLKILSEKKLAYHYRNAGEHYYFKHPVIELGKKVAAEKTVSTSDIKFVNYSPPFQAPHPVPGNRQQDTFPAVLKALRSFAQGLEHEENLFEYKLQEGECVIFNNRRVLHGRRGFEAAVGERWLKGTYVDTDVVMSRFRVLDEKFHHRKILGDGKGKMVIDSAEAEGL